MSDDKSIAEMTLLLTAANVWVNLDILDVSRKLLKINEEHLEVLKEISKEKKNEGNL